MNCFTNALTRLALDVEALSVQLTCDNPSVCLRAIDWKDGPTVSDADKNYIVVLLVKLRTSEFLRSIDHHCSNVPSFVGQNPLNTYVTYIEYYLIQPYYFSVIRNQAVSSTCRE